MEWRCQVPGCGYRVTASRWSKLDKFRQDHIRWHMDTGGTGTSVQAVVSNVVRGTSGRRPAMPATPPMRSVAVKRAQRKCRNCDDMVFDGGTGKVFHIATVFGWAKSHPDADDECICGCVKPE